VEKVEEGGGLEKRGWLFFEDSCRFLLIAASSFEKSRKTKANSIYGHTAGGWTGSSFRLRLRTLLEGLRNQHTTCLARPGNEITAVL